MTDWSKNSASRFSFYGRGGSEEPGPGTYDSGPAFGERKSHHSGVSSVTKVLTGAKQEVNGRKPAVPRFEKPRPKRSSSADAPAPRAASAPDKKRLPPREIPGLDRPERVNIDLAIDDIRADPKGAFAQIRRLPSLLASQEAALRDGRRFKSGFADDASSRGGGEVAGHTSPHRGRSHGPLMPGPIGGVSVLDIPTRRARSLSGSRSGLVSESSEQGSGDVHGSTASLFGRFVGEHGSGAIDGVPTGVEPAAAARGAAAGAGDASGSTGHGGATSRGHNVHPLAVSEQYQGVTPTKPRSVGGRSHGRGDGAAASKDGAYVKRWECGSEAPFRPNLEASTIARFLNAWVPVVSPTPARASAAAAAAAGASAGAGAGAAGGSQGGVCDGVKVQGLPLPVLDATFGVSSLLRATRSGVVACLLLSRTAGADVLDPSLVLGDAGASVGGATAETAEATARRRAAHNWGLCLHSAVAAGCMVQSNPPGVTTEALTRGEPQAVLRLLWEIVYLRLLRPLDVLRFPGLTRLVDTAAGEGLADVFRASKRTLLRRWAIHVGAGGEDDADGDASGASATLATADVQSLDGKLLREVLAFAFADHEWPAAAAPDDHGDGAGDGDGLLASRAAYIGSLLHLCSERSVVSFPWHGGRDAPPVPADDADVGDDGDLAAQAADDGVGADVAVSPAWALALGSRRVATAFLAEVFCAFVGESSMPPNADGVSEAPSSSGAAAAAPGPLTPTKADLPGGLGVPVFSMRQIEKTLVAREEPQDWFTRGIVAWANNTGVVGARVAHVGEALADGIVALKVLETLAPRSVQWERVNMACRNRFKRKGNCAMAVRVARKLCGGNHAPTDAENLDASVVPGSSRLSAAQLSFSSAAVAADLELVKPEVIFNGANAHSIALLWCLLRLQVGRASGVADGDAHVLRWACGVVEAAVPAAARATHAAPVAVSAGAGATPTKSDGAAGPGDAGAVHVADGAVSAAAIDAATAGAAPTEVAPTMPSEVPARVAAVARYDDDIAVAQVKATPAFAAVALSVSAIPAIPETVLALVRAPRSMAAATPLFVAVLISCACPGALPPASIAWDDTRRAWARNARVAVHAARAAGVAVPFGVPSFSEPDQWHRVASILVLGAWRVAREL